MTTSSSTRKPTSTSAPEPADRLIKLFGTHASYVTLVQIFAIISGVSLGVFVLLAAVDQFSRTNPVEHSALGMCLFETLASLFLAIIFYWGKRESARILNTDQLAEARRLQLPLLVMEHLQGNAVSAGDRVILGFESVPDGTEVSYRDVVVSPGEVWQHCSDGQPSVSFPALTLVPLPAGKVSLTRTVASFGTTAVVCGPQSTTLHTWAGPAPTHYQVHGLNLHLL